jgi:hypothetical protein
VALLQNVEDLPKNKKRVLNMVSCHDIERWVQVKIGIGKFYVEKSAYSYQADFCRQNEQTQKYFSTFGKQKTAV